MIEGTIGVGERTTLLQWNGDPIVALDGRGGGRRDEREGESEEGCLAEHGNDAGDGALEERRCYEQERT